MKKIFFFSTLLFGLFFISCEDFIEKNLQKEKITLKSPLDADTILSNTVTFWWEVIEAKDVQYNIQIVENSFLSPTQLILDSNSYDNIYEFSLPNGTYEWRVRAFNNTSETEYLSRTLVVDGKTDLSNEIQTLLSPTNNWNDNNLSQRFKWSKNLNATSYDFELLDNASDVFTYETVSEDTIRVDLIEGIYKWRVKAKNESSETAFSTYRTLLIDNTSPAIPLLINPINNTVQTNTTVSFSWNQGSSLAAVTDTIYIYSDSLVTLFNIVYTSDDNLDYNFSNLGTYFWRIKSGDAAGNASAFSDTRKFTIN